MRAPADPGGFSLPGNPVFIVGYPRSGTTLLQALDTMALDRQAWKMFAEQRVRAYWKSRGATS